MVPQITTAPKDAAKSEPGRNSPWIGRFIIDYAEPQYSGTSIIRTSIIRTLDYPNTSPRSAHKCVNI